MTVKKGILGNHFFSMPSNYDKNSNSDRKAVI